MLAQILQILKPAWLNILKVVAALGGFIFLWMQAKRSGEQTIKQQNLEATIKGVETRDKVKDSIDGASVDERKRLRNKWNRD